MEIDPYFFSRSLRYVLYLVAHVMKIYNKALEEWELYKDYDEGGKRVLVFRMHHIWAKFMEEGFYIFRTDRFCGGDRLMFAYREDVQIESALKDRIDEWVCDASFSDLDIHFLYDLCYLFGDCYLAPMWNDFG